MGHDNNKQERLFLPHDGDSDGAPSAALSAAIPRMTVRIGIGGPVGSGKTALVDVLCRRLAGRIDMAVITNDIYTREDADFLIRAGSLPLERIVGVETGACPHSAVRDD